MTCKALIDIMLPQLLLHIWRAPYSRYVIVDTGANKWQNTAMKEQQINKRMKGLEKHESSAGYFEFKS